MSNNSNTSNRCRKHRVTAAHYNPRRGGLANTYFSQTCPDPYTSLNYWRRRFKNQDCYLGKYFVPYNRRNVPRGPGFFGTRIPYEATGFSLGNVCQQLYLGPHQRCRNRGTAKCGAGV